MKLNQNIKNFGGNITFTAKTYYEPKNDQDVLSILDKHRNDHIRVTGSLHSWSDSVKSESVIVHLKNLNKVKVINEDDRVFAIIGGGCKLNRLLSLIAKKGNFILPSMGAILQQTISGATATGTHGSGSTTMSNFIEEVKVAAYDPETGEPVIHLIKGGQELKAARCHLGCLGIVLEMKIPIVPEYLVEEKILPFQSVEDILNAGHEYPLQQFIYVPYSWRLFSFIRKKANKRSLSALFTAYIIRAANFVILDVVVHAVLIFIINTLKSTRLITEIYTGPFGMMVKREKIYIDTSREVLTLRHELFRHIEMELFIPVSNLEMAVQHARQIIDYCAGRSGFIEQGLYGEVKKSGLEESLKSIKGSYVHHYPLYFRKVLPDDRTLVSMTAGNQEPDYTMSFFTYSKNPEPFFKMADFIARLFLYVHSARPHWGKYFPLKNNQIAPHYPNLNEFKMICNKMDANGVFKNDYTKRVLGY